jgi:plasmid stabilization system protein ParE
MSKLRWTRRALADLIAIGEFIAADNPSAARAWVEKLRAQAQFAAESPRAGRIVPELAVEDVREKLVGAYRIVYRVLPDEILIVMVFEGHRLLPRLAPNEDE